MFLRANHIAPNKIGARSRKMSVKKHNKQMFGSFELSDLLQKHPHSIANAHRQTRAFNYKNIPSFKFREDLESLDWENHRCRSYYEYVGIYSNRFVHSKTFQSIIIAAILTTGLLAGLQTFPEVENSIWKDVISTVEYIILVLFSCEIVMKIIGQRLHPIRFFYGDKEWRWNLFDFFIVIATMFGENSIALFRMLRLLRVLKLIKKVPQFRLILMGLIGGLNSIIYIVVLLFLVLYLYAVIGVYAFRDNDPWHFARLDIALLTLFRIATLEDWTDILYINLYGCANYEYESSYLKGLCVNSQPSPYIAPIYFISFTVISAMVMLSLFIGVITMSMQQCINTMIAEREEAEREKAIREHYGMLQRRKSTGNLSEMAVRALAAWNGEEIDIFDEKTIETIQRSPLRQIYYAFSIICDEIAKSNYFNNFVICTIMVASILVGMQTSKTIEEELRSFIVVTEWAIIGIFILEFLIKIISFNFTPWRYFYSTWNIFDFVIIVFSLLPFGSSTITILRLLRLLRVLKLVKNMPQLQIIIIGLIRGLTSIFFIAVLLIFVLYIFAIAGVIFFRDNDPWHFGSLQRAMLTLFRCSTLEDWTDVMYINMLGCNNYGYDRQSMRHLCQNPQPRGLLAAMFFIVFVVISALIMVTLFVGVVTTSMEQATEEMREELEVEERVKEIVQEHKVTKPRLDRYRELFQVFDLDGSGDICAEELRIAMFFIGQNPTHEQMVEMIDRVDRNGDGSIDFSEFLLFMVLLHKERLEEEKRLYSPENQSKVLGRAALRLQGKVGSSSSLIREEEQELTLGFCAWLSEILSCKIFSSSAQVAPKKLDIQVDNEVNDENIEDRIDDKERGETMTGRVKPPPLDTTLERMESPQSVKNGDYSLLSSPKNGKTPKARRSIRYRRSIVSPMRNVKDILNRHLEQQQKLIRDDSSYQLKKSFLESLTSPTQSSTRQYGLSPLQEKPLHNPQQSLQPEDLPSKSESKDESSNFESVRESTSCEMPNSRSDQLFVQRKRLSPEDEALKSSDELRTPAHTCLKQGSMHEVREHLMSISEVNTIDHTVNHEDNAGLSLNKKEAKMDAKSQVNSFILQNKLDGHGSPADSPRSRQMRHSLPIHLPPIQHSQELNRQKGMGQAREIAPGVLLVDAHYLQTHSQLAEEFKNVDLNHVLENPQFNHPHSNDHNPSLQNFDHTFGGITHVVKKHAPTFTRTSAVAPTFEANMNRRPTLPTAIPIRTRRYSSFPLQTNSHNLVQSGTAPKG